MGTLKENPINQCTFSESLIHVVIEYEYGHFHVTDILEFLFEICTNIPHMVLN